MDKCKFKDLTMGELFEVMGHICMRANYDSLNGYEKHFGFFIRLSDGLCGMWPLDEDVTRVNKRIMIVEA